MNLSKKKSSQIFLHVFNPLESGKKKFAKNHNLYPLSDRKNSKKNFNICCG